MKYEVIVNIGSCFPRIVLHLGVIQFPSVGFSNHIPDGFNAFKNFTQGTNRCLAISAIIIENQNFSVLFFYDS